MKKLICSIVYVFFTIVAAKNINAQGLKFGHINSNEIMLAMPEFDSAGIKLEKFRHELEKLLETMTLELNDKYNAYIKDNKSLSDIVILPSPTCSILTKIKVLMYHQWLR